jgi:hypothetical protein
MPETTQSLCTTHPVILTEYGRNTISLPAIPVLRVLFKRGYKWNLPTSAMPRKPSLTREYDNRLRAAKEITISGSPRTLPVSTVSITLFFVWWWSHIPNVLSVLVEVVHVWVWCGNRWIVSAISWSQKFFKLKRTSPSPGRTIPSLREACSLRKTLRQTQDRAKQKLFVC